MINVAVLGYGTVGSGIVEVINTNKEVIRERVGKEIKVSYVLDLREFPGDPVSDILVHDYEIIINDPKVVIIAEAMGAVEPPLPAPSTLTQIAISGFSYGAKVIRKPLYVSIFLPFTRFDTVVVPVFAATL